MNSKTRGLTIDAGESQRPPVSKTLVALSISNVIAIGTLALSIGFHSSDSSAALEQRVSASEEAIRDNRQLIDHADARQQAFQLHMDQRFDIEDGKLTDIYHILLQQQPGARR